MNITRYLKKNVHTVWLQSSKCWRFLKIFTYEKHLYLLQHMSVRTGCLACVVSVTVSPSDCLYQNQQESLRFSWPPKIWLQSLYSCQYFDDKKTRKLTRKHGFLDSYGGAGGNRQCLLLQHCWEKLVSYQQLASRCPPDWPSLIYFIQ